MQGRSLVTILTVAALGVVGFASGPVPELRLPAGQPAQGEIAYDGEEDRVAVDLLAGQKLSFTAKASRRSALRIAGGLLAADGNALASPPTLVANATSFGVAKWPVPTTGTYLVSVRGTPAGPTGLYDLVAHATSAPKRKPTPGEISVGAPTQDFDVDALAGSTMTVSVKAAKKSPLTPRVVLVTSPDGSTLDLGGVKRHSTAHADSVKAIPLPSFGTWHVRIGADAGTTGLFTVTISVHAPKVPKARLDFRGASGGESTAGGITAIEIIPHSMALSAGASLQAHAKATYADGRVRDATRAVTWGTRNRRFATVGDAVTCGRVTAGTEPGGTTVQAWAAGVEAREAVALVGGVVLSDVTVLPANAIVASGDTIALQATAATEIGNPGVVVGDRVDLTNAAEWAVASGAASSFQGPRLTAGATPGPVQVTASAAGVSSPQRLVTVVARRVERIAVTPAYAEMVGGTRSFTAVATYADGTTADVTATATWSSDNLAAATSNGGTATFVAAGTAGIRATLDGVTSRGAVLDCGPVPLQAVVVHAGGVPRGATRAFTADGVFADGGTRDLTEAATWMSASPAVVTVSTIPGLRGTATAVAQTGSSVVTASVVTGSATRSGQAVATASAAERADLVIVPRITNVGVAGTTAFRAFARRSDGTFEDVSAAALWGSSNRSIADVAAGDVTGVADGGSVITASLDGRTAHAIALVGTGTVSGIEVNAVPPGAIGTSARPTTRIAFLPASGPDPLADVGAAASWFSSNPIGSPVTDTGLLSVRRADSTDLTAAVAGTVSSARLVSGAPAADQALVVFPQEPAGAAGVDVQLAAQVAASDGSIRDRASACGWSSESTAFATVGPTGLVHPVARGSSAITATLTGSTLTDTTSFTTLSDPPTLSAVLPTTLTRGTSGTLVTLSGAHLDGTNPSASFGGSGISVDDTPSAASDGLSATFHVSVAAGAPLGQQGVTYTTRSGSSTLPNAITVTTGVPTLTSISPPNIVIPVAGMTQTTVTLTGTNFAAGDTFTLQPQPGVTLAGVQVTSSTTMTGTVTVLQTAFIARLAVTMTQSVGNGGQSVSAPGLLKIGPVDPTVASVVPDHVLPYAHTVSGRVVGTNFSPGIVLFFVNASSAISNLAYTWQSSTLITFTFDVSATSAVGVYDMTLQNTGDVPAPFTGVLVVSPADPVITGCSAVSLARGAVNLPVEVLGANFRSGDALAASGSGVSFSSVTIASAGRITANASVASGATLSARDLVVSHAASVGGRSATLSAAFVVTDGTPNITSCTPPKVGRTGSSGPTRRVPIVLAGTGFCSGATVTVSRDSSSGLTVVANTTVVASDTEIRFDLDVAGSATVAPWDVQVINPGSLGNSGSSGNGRLEVVAESTLNVNRVAAPTGSAQGGERVTVYGSGFVRGCQVEFGTEKSPAVQFLDQNTLVCTVPAPADPSTSGASTVSRTATTYVTVKVTVRPGQQTSANATLSPGYGYLPAATAFKILQSFPADSSTGAAQNLKSAVVRLSDYANTHTAVFGTSQGTNFEWFEAGSFLVSNQTGGFGADRRFLVFSRTGGGNLPINSSGVNAGRYVLESPTALRAASGASLVPAKLPQTSAYDQWYFTISGSVTDTTAPTISSINPANNATGVAATTAVAITFSEEIDPLTVTTSSITLTQGANTVACAVALSSDIKTVTLTPYLELAASTAYTVTITNTVADLCGNAVTQTTRSFTTGSGTDTTAPTIDSVTFEQIPSDMDGSTTCVSGTDSQPTFTANSSAAFDLYLPRSGWTVAVTFSDAGSGIDETQFSAKASVASGSTSTNGQLAGKFTVTSTGASWTIASTDALTAGEDVTLTFTVKDVAGNTSSQKVVTFDTVDINGNAAAAVGGNFGPFDSRETWVLRFDRDVYTASFSTTGVAPNATQQVTTTAATNGIADVEESLRLCGLTTANMTTDAAKTSNGPSLGTNAIVVRLFEERVRATLRARYGIAEDGSRNADSANIEFLLPGEQGSLASLPNWTSSSSSSTGKAFSEMDIGGDIFPNSLGTTSYGTIGYAYFDLRNLVHEANVNDAIAFQNGSNVGVFALNAFKFLVNVSSTGTSWGARVTGHFLATRGGTPVGENSLDDDVLAGTFDRTAAANTQAQNDRYDQIMDAIEAAALSISGTTAHEIGHSVGLVADLGPKTGQFGNAPHANTFTEATAGSPNTPGHLDALGNDIMGAASSVDQRMATGTDFMRFAPLQREYLLHRAIFDEGR